MLESKEKISNHRYPLIAVVGPPGSGKSTLVEKFKELTRIDGLEEQHWKVRNLKDFYLGDSAKYAFQVQTQFQDIRAASMPEIQKHLGLPAGGPLLLDSCFEADTVMEGALHRMRLISDRDHFRYIARKKKIENDPNFISPDILIFLRPPAALMDKWIVTRNRNMEIVKRRKDPSYFYGLADAFDVWFEDLMPSGKGVIPVDIAKYDIVTNSIEARKLVKDCCDWAGYLLSATHSRGLGGVGSDGARLIVPSFLRPAPGSYAQSSSLSNRLQGT